MPNPLPESPTEPTAQSLKGHRGLDRIVRAAGHSWRGLQAAFHHESAFRQELCMVIVLAPLGWWLANSWQDLALLWGSLLAVLVVELLNSAIEAVVDRVSLDLHPMSGRAKDMASAAVLITLVGMALVWVPALWLKLA